MLSVVTIVGAVLAAAVWIAAALGARALRRLRHELEATRRELDEDLREHADMFRKADRFAWSVRRRWDQPCPPGPDDPPLLYVLPGAKAHTNSCEEARRAWMNAATEARDLIAQGKVDEAATLLNVTIHPQDAARRIDPDKVLVAM